MVNEQIKADGTLVSIDVWRDDPSKVRIFIKDRDTIIIPRNYLYEMRQCIDDLSGGEGYKFEPQESNKEEMGKGCYTDKLGQLVHDIPHTCQEPSKKPSEGIEKFVIGCSECGNNIKI